MTATGAHGGAASGPGPVGPVDAWSCPTTIHVGRGMAPRILAGLAGRSPVAVVDEAVVRAHPSLLAALGPAPDVVVRRPGDADLDLVDRVLGAAGARPDAVLVAVGGGSVMDVAKLAAVLRAGHGDALRAALDRHDGLLLWPAATRAAGSDVLCVPTTVGTAAECSPIAVVRRPGGLVMVVGAGLRPRFAVLDPDVTATAPHPVLVAGLAETLARVAVPAVAGSGLLLQDAVAAALARTVLVLAERADRVIDADWTEAAALASAQTHTAFLSIGRSPFGHVLWPVATELANATGVAKGAALAGLLPAWLDGLADGWLGSAFGTADRVREILGQPPRGAADRVRTAFASLRPDVAVPLPAASVDRVVAAVESRWQVGGPFLAGVPRRELSRLVGAATG